MDNAAAAHCSDTGHGAADQPYCTIGAAAKVVNPGQTVHIAEGSYPETVTLTRSGTAEAPITFTGAGAGLSTLAPVGSKPRTTLVGASGQSGPDQALVLDHASHVRIHDLALAGLKGAVTVDGGSDLTLSRARITSSSAFRPTIEVKGAAQGLTVQRTTGAGAPYLHLSPGVEGTVVSTNDFGAELDRIPALEADSAPGTVIVSNTIARSENVGIAVTGTATGTVVENNVLSGLSSDSPQMYVVAALAVDAEAARGIKADYNSFAGPGRYTYDWAGTKYSYTKDFTAVTGQGQHDGGDFAFVNSSYSDPGTGSSAIDSADESAPGMLDTDLRGLRPVDDPYAANTGTGSGLRDRGAYEIDDFAARYTPVGPVRVLDTRTGGGKAVAPGGTVDLPIAGLNGLPATGLTAVTMNVTVTGGTGPGYLTVYPHGADRPLASNLNWTAGQIIPNLVTTKVSDGKVSFYNGSQGTVHIVADLLGAYARTGSGYTTATPTRLLDTRDGTGAAKAPLTNGKPVDLQIAGVRGVPKDITAVTLNVTATGTTDHGYLTAYPHGSARPTASNLNWTAGQTIPNLVTVPVKDGRISLVTGGTNGTANVVADLAGYFTATGGDTYHALTPYRLLDTRTDKAVGPYQTTQLPTGVTRADSVAMNVTVTGGTAPGFLTAFPVDANRPLASNLNWTTGQTIPNQVVVKQGWLWDSSTNIQGVSFYNGSIGPVQVVADLNGYYAP
ncbi:hypothetical protein CFP65_3839 [Kitasatospora sp. MMS16-BH015]|uniref:hypothetical protein n=1 Tax=Kitasatospora sp. MMS16-BH015 TaxID=2018025 RepID=UPI000CA19B8D|nr:hypothetical protein [Kitasatospora sp. MMS16-BH015]AUG78619.1 hypothetical protein CFP65_3839 [Kitasatospora sp. MMS16-BH015]